MNGSKFVVICEMAHNEKRAPLPTPFVSVFWGIALLAILAGPALGYDEGKVEGGGTIEGKVTYNGAVETRKVIPTKDTDTCGGVREDPLIKVGADKAVEGAVVYLVNVSKGKAWPEKSRKSEVDNVHCRFVPDVQVIPAGTLHVVNKDPVLHNTHGYYGRRTAFNMALPNKGQDIPADLTRAGTVKLDCDAHGWMEGWIYVRDNPYYAITGADGKFSITEVPPGEYELVAVQALTGPNPQKVKVESGKPTTLAIELTKKKGAGRQ